MNSRLTSWLFKRMRTPISFQSLSARKTKHSTSSNLPPKSHSNLYHNFKRIPKEAPKAFSGELRFDKDGKLLVLSHESAGYYYKLNFLFLAVWFWYSYRLYKEDRKYFLNNKYVGGAYVGGIGAALLFTVLMSRRHIRMLYLHKCGEQVSIISQWNHIFWYSERLINISSLRGVRHILSPRLHLYQLDYDTKGWLKNRETYSIFRPESVFNFFIQLYFFEFAFLLYSFDL